MVVAMSFTLLRHRPAPTDFSSGADGLQRVEGGIGTGPRGFGTMFSMMMVGQMARRGYDTRSYVGLGFLLMALGLGRCRLGI